MFQLDPRVPSISKRVRVLLHISESLPGSRRSMSRFPGLKLSSSQRTLRPFTYFLFDSPVRVDDALSHLLSTKYRAGLTSYLPHFFQLNNLFTFTMKFAASLLFAVAFLGLTPIDSFAGVTSVAAVSLKAREAMPIPAPAPQRVCTKSHRRRQVFGNTTASASKKGSVVNRANLNAGNNTVSAISFAASGNAASQGRGRGGRNRGGNGGGNNNQANQANSSTAAAAASIDAAAAASSSAAANNDAATAASSSADVAAAASSSNNNNNNNNNGGGGGGGNNSDLSLDPANVQSASDSTGQAGSGAEAGQVNSATDPANFINFCTGKTLTNGLQVKGGSCNGVVMGDIPSTSNMISSIITGPSSGEDIQADTTFSINVLVANLAAGQFTNAQTTYYSAPQQLQNGQVLGHTHVTIQDLSGTTNPTAPLDATTFAFFKGINDAGTQQGNGVRELSAVVTGGLAQGCYRVCTMSSASNHQPVLMPVAQRGAQDDCLRFSVGGGCSDLAAKARRRMMM
ncbi:hypothetical protein G7K_2336-t1 [Saitoella complicata NRRL Y-17804]|uniref:Ribosomal protein s17 n=1 Tax=Saitoella complicata (strain BCRC 22490 / CBS 7301 / JCM 7358 / NBRC 10748 / NRRL Y-17804) TaxID=698492 RepID=A0A0E9NEN0_SAICN|nr:hypothetical protein G7K_2336-t1 [Saitoella complicata NRRL Y-17804]